MVARAASARASTVAPGTMTFQGPITVNAGAQSIATFAQADDFKFSLPHEFMFATGIECSAPTIGHGRIRRDLLAECGHYERWQEDLALVADMGIRFLRYGLPYHLTHLGPDRYDWSFADLAMHEM